MIYRLLFVSALLCAGAVPALAQGDIAPTGTLRAAYLFDQSGAVHQGPADRRVARRVVRARARARQADRQAARLQADRRPAGGDRGGRERRGRHRLRRLRGDAARHGRILADLHAGAAELPGAGQLADRQGRRRRSQPARRSPAPATIRSRSASSACSSRRRRWSSTTIPRCIAKALRAGEIDALGANRQRLTTLSRSVPGSRLLAGQSLQRAAEHRGADGQARRCWRRSTPSSTTCAARASCAIAIARQRRHRHRAGAEESRQPARLPGLTTAVDQRHARSLCALSRASPNSRGYASVP